MRTYQLVPKKIKRKWHLIDAKGKVLGRLATEIARLLVGKNKVDYTPHIDMGDYVVVINAKQVVLTGNKGEEKVYFRHSGYPGGLRQIKFSKLIQEAPEKVIQHAVSGMLPDNRLKAKRLKRLKIFPNERHSFGDKF